MSLCAHFVLDVLFAFLLIMVISKVAVWLSDNVIGHKNESYSMSSRVSTEMDDHSRVYRLGI